MEMENIPSSTPAHSLDQFDSAIKDADHDHYVFISGKHVVSSSSLDEKQDHQETRKCFKEALLEKYPNQKDFVDQLLDVELKEPLSAARMKEIKLQVAQALLDAPPIRKAEGIDEDIKAPEPTPTRVFGIPITEEQLKRITAVTALAQGSIGLVKGGVTLAALGTTGALLAVPLGVLIVNHFTSKSDSTKVSLTASEKNPAPQASVASPTGHLNGHQIRILDHASKTAEAHTKHAYDALGIGFAVQLEGQFLHALVSAHATVTPSPMALIVAGAWVTGFASGIVSFHRAVPTHAAQDSSADREQ